MSFGFWQGRWAGEFGRSLPGTPLSGKVTWMLVAWNLLNCALKLGNVIDFLVWLVIVVGSECGCEFLCNGERSSGPRNARGALWHVMGPLAVAVKTLRQAECCCTVLVYHMCCLLGPSAFSHVVYDNCVPVLSQLFLVFAFCPLGLIVSSATQLSQPEPWKRHGGDFLSSHLSSGGSQVVFR